MPLQIIRAENEGGGAVWVVVHCFSLKDEWLRSFRPIHALTFLAKYIAQGYETFSLTMALEDKLFSVKHRSGELRASMAQADEVLANTFVRDYANSQRIMCDLNAYLNAIYSALEVTALLNRRIHSGLPISFSRRSEKFESFSPKTWKWLDHFYDMRSELTHFNSALPVASKGEIVVKFAQTKKMKYFKKGRHVVPFDHVLAYQGELMSMLDQWALQELEVVDPDLEISVHTQPLAGHKLSSETIKASELLKHLKAFRVE